MFKNKKNNLDNMLDECLERILVDGESIEGCLAGYPEYHDELKSLLDVAVSAKTTVSCIEARPEFKARLRYQVSSDLKPSSAPKRSAFRWQYQWAPMAVSFCIVLLLSGGGVVAASSNSMPDDPLYNVKLATEQVQLFFTFSNQGKAELYTEFVNERVTEIVNMASENNAAALEKSSNRMGNQLSMMADVSATGSDLSEFVPTSEETLAAVTNTVGGGSYITDTETGINTTPTITTTTTITTNKGLSPSAISTDDRSQHLLDILATSYNNNLDALNSAIGNASGDVLQALLDAIAMLENGYNTTVDNIS
jgi:hypothetical protein